MHGVWWVREQEGTWHRVCALLVSAPLGKQSHSSGANSSDSRLNSMMRRSSARRMSTSQPTVPLPHMQQRKDSIVMIPRPPTKDNISGGSGPVGLATSAHGGVRRPSVAGSSASVSEEGAIAIGTFGRTGTKRQIDPKKQKLTHFCKVR